MKKVFAFITLLIVMQIFDKQPQSKNYQTLSTAQLIDELVNIDSEGVGFHSTASAISFIVESDPPKFGGGVLESPRPIIPPQTKELVKRGSEALPELINHLSDKRPTKLQVGNRDRTSPNDMISHTNQNEFHFMFEYYGSEYDPKIRAEKILDSKQLENELKRIVQPSRYTVKVGDICYALIGQIVNRRLLPIRYQPSAGLVINSPIETPELIDKVMADWGKATKDDLLKSLLNDIEKASSYEVEAKPALQRLQFYFPSEFAKLNLWKIRKKLK